eukprot:gene3956-38710_t
MTHHCTPRCRPAGWAHLCCSDGFPFPLCALTHADPRGSIEYCRLTEEDAWVAPHNREILLELDCHYYRAISALRKVL